LRSELQQASQRAQDEEQAK